MKLHGLSLRSPGGTGLCSSRPGTTDMYLPDSYAADITVIFLLVKNFLLLDFGQKVGDVFISK
jgi:hypothetical protein